MDALRTPKWRRTRRRPGCGLRIDGEGQHAHTLYRRLKKLPGPRSAVSTVATGRGRRTRRSSRVGTGMDRFTGAAQIAQLRRTVTQGGKKTIEVVYLVTSADAGRHPTTTLASWVGPLAHRKPAPLGPGRHLPRKDKSLVRTGNAPRLDGHATQPRDQPAPPRRTRQHRRRQPAPRPRPTTHHHPASVSINDFYRVPEVVVDVDVGVVDLGDPGAVAVPGAWVGDVDDGVGPSAGGVPVGVEPVAGVALVFEDVTFRGPGVGTCQPEGLPGSAGGGAWNSPLTPSWGTGR